jgi:hypothetical protein
MMMMMMMIIIIIIIINGNNDWHKYSFRLFTLFQTDVANEAATKRLWLEG